MVKGVGCRSPGPGLSAHPRKISSPLTCHKNLPCKSLPCLFSVLGHCPKNLEIRCCHLKGAGNMRSPALSHFTFASDPLQGRCQRWHRSLSKSHSPLGNYKPTGHPGSTPFLLKMQLHTCPSATQGKEQEFTSFLLQIQKTETFGLGGKACFSVKTLFMCAVAFGRRMRHDLVQPPLAEMFPEW